jgi:hypothetical protein
MLRLLNLPSALLLAIAPVIGIINPALSQPNLPTCQSPNPGQYLLLVISPTVENQKQLRNALPDELTTNTCKYLDQTVTRIGGFKSIDDANRWARYINNITGLSAIISTRPTGLQAEHTSKLSYSPQALGEGYAVLVDYFNRPDMARNVQQVLGSSVGLVSYGQRPYLLALHTTHQKEAYNTLQKLNEHGFFAILVDSRKVVVLRSVVSLK